MTAAFGFLDRVLLSNPWRTLFFVALLVLGFQTVRIDGFTIGPVHAHGLKNDLADARQALKDTKDSYRLAQVQAEAAQRAVNAAQATHFAEVIERNDREHATLLAGLVARTDAALPAMRLRFQQALGGASGGGNSTAQAAGAGVHQDVPADPLVVGSADVLSCTKWVAFGIKARDVILQDAQ